MTQRAPSDDDAPVDQAGASLHPISPQAAAAFLDVLATCTVLMLRIEALQLCLFDVEEPDIDWGDVDSDGLTRVVGWDT